MDKLSPLLLYRSCLCVLSVAARSGRPRKGPATREVYDATADRTHELSGLPAAQMPRRHRHGAGAWLLLELDCASAVAGAGGQRLVRRLCARHGARAVSTDVALAGGRGAAPAAARPSAGERTALVA